MARPDPSQAEHTAQQLTTAQPIGNNAAMASQAKRERRRARRASDQQAKVAESFVVDGNEFVDRGDYAPVGFGFMPFGDWNLAGRLQTSINDRQHGDDAPYIENEQDAAMARGLARFITKANCAGVGILEILVNHVVGEGATFTTGTKSKQCPPGLPEAVKDVTDEFVDINDFTGMMDRELYRRDCRDGESPAGLFPKAGVTTLRCIEPDCISDPGGEILTQQELAYYHQIQVDQAGACWKYGVHTSLRDVRNVYGYAVRWSPEEAYDYLPARYVDFSKVNVDSNVKRGMSDFYPAYKHLRQQERLLINTGEGAAELSAISYILQMANATQAQARSMVQDQSEVEYQRRMSGSPYPIYHHRRQPGTHLVVPKGQEYMPGPMGAERGQAFLEVVNGILRQCGIRWNMTEGMVTGYDANNNMASAVVAGSRFHKYCQAQQGRTRTRFKRIVWRAVEFAHAAGRFARFNLTYQEVMKLIEIECELPEIATLEPDKLEQIREIRKRNGVLSRRTWAAQVKLDHDVQVKEGAHDEMAAAAAATGLAGTPAQQPATGEQPPGEGGEIITANDVAKTTLNGAQVQSMVDILDKAAQGVIPDESVGPILAAAFPVLTPEQINAIVAPLKGFKSAAPAEGGGQQRQPGEFGNISTLQWKRNTKAIRGVLDQVKSKEISAKQAEAMLETLGLPPDRVQKLLGDVGDDGQLTPANLQSLAENEALRISTGWRLVVEARRALEDCGTGAGGFKGGNTCATGDGGGVDPKRKPRRLNTDTPEFKAWFGDSKVVDEHGEPLVVYHGSGHEFKTFEHNKAGRANTRDAKLAHYFTTSADVASEYAWHKSEHIGIIKPVYLRMENPLVVKGSKYYDPNYHLAALKKAQAEGHDGVIFKGQGLLGGDSDHYAVFDNTQIKSATGNRGTFSRDSANITETWHDYP